jgi:hypothetical protein
MGATGGFHIQGFPHRGQSDAFNDVSSLSLDTKMGGMHLVVTWAIPQKKHALPSGRKQEFVRRLKPAVIRKDGDGRQMRRLHDLESYCKLLEGSQGSRLQL